MSLDGHYDPANPFARILRGELPCATVFEDEQVLALMDAFPQSRGHALVIPKRSTARNLLEAEPEVVSAVFAATQRLARAVRAALQPDGIQVMQFNGSPAGQTVFHLHVHVIPRWADQGIGLHGRTAAADLGELKALAAQIAQHA
jgi:histidine triad (HIT) family protein